MAKTAGKKQRAKRAETGRYHDSKSGQYVDKETAARRPGRVQAETKIVEKKK